jgi:hypothetical protein
MQDNPSSFIYGCGYGSLVNLKFWAFIMKDAKGMKYISELHNGYAFVLYKTGDYWLHLLDIFIFIIY